MADAEPTTAQLRPLTAMPNVGPKVARRLHAMDIREPADLRGRDPQELYERSCVIEGRREDPCVLDTLTAVVAFAETGDDRPWWAFSEQRKERERA